MTTETQTVTVELNNDDLSFYVAAFAQMAHYVKESRDTAAETAEEKAHDQRIIDKAHGAIEKLLNAALEARGLHYATALHMQANEIWDYLVGEQAGSDKETAEADEQTTTADNPVSFSPASLSVGDRVTLAKADALDRRNGLQQGMQGTVKRITNGPTNPLDSYALVKFDDYNQGTPGGEHADGTLSFRNIGVNQLERVPAAA